MKINFEEIKKQDVGHELLVHILEVIYNEVKSTTTPNIIFNELVDNLEADKNEHSTYYFSLSREPLSLNDMLIVTDDGSIVITPNSITKIEGNKIFFKNLQVSSEMNLFVTYKY